MLSELRISVTEFKPGFSKNKKRQNVRASVNRKRIKVAQHTKSILLTTLKKNFKKKT